MFSKIHQELGTIKGGKTITVDFPYEGIVVTKMTSSCGCGVVYDKKELNKVSVNYTPTVVSNHLIDRGTTRYEAAKSVLVEYYTLDQPSASRSITLTFKATIV